MNNVMAFLKTRWLIVVLTFIALAALPTMYYFSSSMSAKMRAAKQTEVNELDTAIRGSKVPYYVLTPTGDKALEKNTDVNAVLTKWYTERAEEIREKTSKVADEAIAFNKGDHKLLVEGLFPDADDLSRATLKRQLAGKFIAAHPAMLAAIGAGDPPEETSVSEQLTAFNESERRRIENETGRKELEPGERDRLSAQLRDMRLQRYRQRAAELLVYANSGVFVGVPTELPLSEPSMGQVWDWQERFWIHEDVVKAIQTANTGGDASSGGGVPAGVIKRVLRVEVKPSKYVTSDGKEASPAPFDVGSDKAPEDLSRGITGRFSGPGSKNRWYDTRNVIVELIADSRRLPAFIDALAATNFMSVVDLDIYSIDLSKDLEAGYYYGDNHVVRARMEIETIWLRDGRRTEYKVDETKKDEAWKQFLMPKSVQAALGMLEGAEGAPPAEAAPTPRPRRNAPAEGGSDEAPSRGRRGGPE